MKGKESKTLESAILNVLKKGPSTLQMILSSVPRLKEDWALEILRYLADEGAIVKNEDNRWKWIG